MISLVDSFLNRITMYRLMLYYLIFLVMSAGFFGIFGFIPYSPQDLLFSTATAITAGYISNYIFSKIFKAETNIESVFISSLILVLIMPIGFPKDLLFLSLASFTAMASKYILAINRRHIFNPAAFSALLMGVFLGFPASWWVGSLAMFPLILLGGLLILRKTQKEKLAVVFFAIFFVIISAGTFFTTLSFETVYSALRVSLFESALPFFMFVMLIEPLTTPTRKVSQIFYAIAVSFFYSVPQVGLLALAITPEAALCIGNAFSYLSYPNHRLFLTLKNKIQLSKDTYSLFFGKEKNFNFLPGQYMEWTLSHKNSDSRGNRRYFSLSSSPSEDNIAVTIRLNNPSSSFKKELVNIDKNKKIIASLVSGDFVLPKDLKIPIAFIAGGIGITPFRSMIKYITDKKLQADITLLYINKTSGDIVFKDIFENAKKNGVKTIYFLTDSAKVPSNWRGETGHLDEGAVKEIIKDYKSRIFYISGPQLMIKKLQLVLLNLGVKKNSIKTDFFPGYSDK